MQLSQITKAILNVLTVILTAGPWVLDVLKVFPGGTGAAAAVSSILAVVGFVVHYLTPNTTTDPQVAATQSVRLKSAA